MTFVVRDKVLICPTVMAAATRRASGAACSKGTRRPWRTSDQDDFTVLTYAWRRSSTESVARSFKACLVGRSINPGRSLPLQGFCWTT